MRRRTLEEIKKKGRAFVGEEEAVVGGKDFSLFLLTVRQLDPEESRLSSRRPKNFTTLTCVPS